jgi:hypothetical protein
MANEFQRGEVGGWGIRFLFVAGAGLLLAAVPLWNNESLGPTALSFGGCFVGLGVYFWWQNRKRAEAWAGLPEGWPRAEADAVRFVFGADGYGLPGRIEAEFRDSAGRVRTFVSAEVEFNAQSYLPAKLQVAYQGEESRMDPAFLPKVKFLDLPVLYTLPGDLQVSLKKTGKKLEAEFAGFKMHASGEEPDDFDTRTIVLQRWDPAAGVLYVMDGFYVTNEKQPFPKYKLGEKFGVWTSQDDPAGFLVER